MHSRCSPDVLADASRGILNSVSHWESSSRLEPHARRFGRFKGSSQLGRGHPVDPSARPPAPTKHCSIATRRCSGRTDELATPGTTPGPQTQGCTRPLCTKRSMTSHDSHPERPTLPELSECEHTKSRGLIANKIMYGISTSCKQAANARSEETTMNNTSPKRQRGSPSFDSLAGASG